MRPWRIWVTSLLSGGGAAVVVGGRAAPAVAVTVTLVLVVALRHVEPSEVRRERARASAQLPIAADLLAAALRAGATPDTALQTVGEALASPLGDRLVGVARALRVGYQPREAWSQLADIPGAGSFVRAAVRSVESGTTLTSTLDRLAADLRAERAAAADATARRVGVLTVLPLGLCFLPAFLLTGVVPVVVAVLGEVLGS